MNRVSTIGLALAVAIAGCGDEATGNNPDGGGSCTPNTGVDSTTCPPRYTENVMACMPAATDYQPRAMKSGGFMKCISDDNTFHLVDMQLPPAAARVTAFEAMARKLWKNGCIPTAADFTSARDDYSVAEGLASRIARRQDVFYPEVTVGGDKFACADQAVYSKAENANRCAGPARLMPVINEAFTAGIAGTKPVVQAAKIETALLWFFYLSSRSEVWTCAFDDKTDCDAAAAYYTQDPTKGRTPTAGVAKYIFDMAPETHQRIFDALLAERCWADLEMFPRDYENSNLYKLAQAQLDKAYLRGMALILRSRIGSVGCSTGERQEAMIESVKLLGGVMYDHAAALDKTNADKLKTYTGAPSTDAAAISAAQAAIDAIFPCP